MRFGLTVWLSITMTHFAIVIPLHAALYTSRAALAFLQRDAKRSVCDVALPLTAMRLRAASFGVTRSCLNKVYLSVCQRRYQAASFQFTAVPECVGTSESPKWITICGQPYPRDAWFNIPPRIIGLSDRRLHNQKYHPLCLIKQRIVDFMYKRHSRRDDNGQVSRPLFSLHDTLSPVVTTRQNFDSLLIPPDHPSRALTDTYYVNQSTLLRSHTSAHQLDLIRSGLDAFLLAGDVYRRDEIDSLHYPVFHQLEGVRLFTSEEVTCQLRWVDAYFPFTHPSWELEVKTKLGYNADDEVEEWTELLGCGLMRQELLERGE
ncbi:Phenylalanine--tRNA ligase [Paragonimus heterotremus]|uniref:Phenylalanine--tRNA ligase n=1 Tax=Paragonimus heterotremus TaxID=100268 RepID=A0A8J4WDS7_9TREM|nr:Phenylalanine--tRNA ligase [Paragonimus heterotremus]